MKSKSRATTTSNRGALLGLLVLVLLAVFLTASVAPESRVRWVLGGGVVAAVLLALGLGRVLSWRSRRTQRDLGIGELESRAAVARRVGELLRQDGDLRVALLCELDRAEDALADAHHHAQGRGENLVARVVHERSVALRELRRRVKLTPRGSDKDFIEGVLPRQNLESLVGWLVAVRGQMAELFKEAMAARDAVTAGGDPAKNLRLMGGMALQIQGKLGEREAYFRTIA